MRSVDERPESVAARRAGGPGGERERVKLTRGAGGARLGADATLVRAVGGDGGRGAGGGGAADGGAVGVDRDGGPGDRAGDGELQRPGGGAVVEVGQAVRRGEAGIRGRQEGRQA